MNENSLLSSESNTIYLIKFLLKGEHQRYLYILSRVLNKPFYQFYTIHALVIRYKHEQR